MISKPYEDIVVGERAVSGEREITGEYVHEFADLTWDRHPLHMDKEYAAQSRFGDNIAHGALMISTLLGLVELHPSYLQCFYGLDKLRFVAPAYFGETVHAETTVLSVSPSSSGGSAVVTSHAQLLDSSGKELMTGEFSLLVAGREQAMALPTSDADESAKAADLESN